MPTSFQTIFDSGLGPSSLDGQDQTGHDMGKCTSHYLWIFKEENGSPKEQTNNWYINKCNQICTSVFLYSYSGKTELIVVQIANLVSESRFCYDDA